MSIVISHRRSTINSHEVQSMTTISTIDVLKWKRISYQIFLIQSKTTCFCFVLNNNDNNSKIVYTYLWLYTRRTVSYILYIWRQTHSVCYHYHKQNVILLCTKSFTRCNAFPTPFSSEQYPSNSIYPKIIQYNISVYT